MHNFKVRSIEPSDAQLYCDWLWADRKINLVDTDVYNYPTCISLVVDCDDEPILINSFHVIMVIDKNYITYPTIMMEALATKPGTPHIVLALKELYRGVGNIANAFGIQEIWLQSIVEQFQEFLESHGFKAVENLLKLKINMEDQPVREMWIEPADSIDKEKLLSAGAKNVVVPTFRGEVGVIG